MRDLQRRMRAEFERLGCVNIRLDPDHRHPRLLADIGDDTVCVDFSTTASGNGCDLANKLSQIRRAVFAITGVRHTERTPRAAPRPAKAKRNTPRAAPPPRARLRACCDPPPAASRPDPFALLADLRQRLLSG